VIPLILERVQRNIECRPIEVLTFVNEDCVEQGRNRSGCEELGRLLTCLGPVVGGRVPATDVGRVEYLGGSAVDVPNLDVRNVS
jgi:hypothetical protein